jgi:predicted N-acetyltransferase YhbS
VDHGVDPSPQPLAIEADGDLVGIVVLQHATAAGSEPRLRWLIIDRWHQRRRIGSAVVGLVADVVRSEGHSALSARWPDGRGGPGRFFETVGFVPVESVDGVMEGRLDVSER